jgi:hypothetical protein
MTSLAGRAQALHGDEIANHASELNHAVVAEVYAYPMYIDAKIAEI